MQDFHQLNGLKEGSSSCASDLHSFKRPPPSENVGLTLHLRRSAMAVARTIAEGCGCGSDAEFAVDLKKARAAGYELESILLLCRDLGFWPEPLHQDLDAEVAEVRKMISGLITRVLAPQPVR